MAKAVIAPALGVIVILIGIIAAIMIHHHDRRVAQRELIRQDQKQAAAFDKQALIADCIKLKSQGISAPGCNRTLGGKK